MASLIAAARDPAYPADIALVLSNCADAAGLTLARDAGIEARAIDHRSFGRDRGAHEAAIHAVLTAAGIEIVCLAGYMRLLTPFLVGAWRGRMLNIHPSLLPSFPGLHTHARAIAAGVKLHGCTVHDRGFVGLSTTVMNGCVIESDGMLAAGALLTPGKRIASRQLWGGRPAAYMRDLTDAQLAEMQLGVAHYVANARAHMGAISGTAL